MKITTTSQYAIKTILYLAIKPGLSTIKEVSDAMDISPDYEMKITRILKKAGFINVVRGVRGGIILLKDPKDITLYDIINVIDPAFCENDILDGKKYFYGPYLQEKMDLYACLVNIQNELNKYLKVIPISSLISSKK